MVNLNDTATQLRARRKVLSDQLEAVDEALALDERRDLSRTGSEGNGPRATGQATEVFPTKLKPAKTLSDDHRHALNEGRRNAQHLREVAAGRARELSDARPGLAPAPSADGQRPRLVKQKKR